MAQDGELFSPQKEGKQAVSIAQRTGMWSGHIQLNAENIRPLLPLTSKNISIQSPPFQWGEKTFLGESDQPKREGSELEAANTQPFRLLQGGSLNLSRPSSTQNFEAAFRTQMQIKSRQPTFVWHWEIL